MPKDSKILHLQTDEKGTSRGIIILKKLRPWPNVASLNTWSNGYQDWDRPQLLKFKKKV